MIQLTQRFWRKTNHCVTSQNIAAEAVHRGLSGPAGPTASCRSSPGVVSALNRQLSAETVYRKV